ncbi:hypothetical protein Tco_0494166 [Tanacetum coccineum]
MMQVASCTQRKVSIVPFVFSIHFVLRWGGSISSDSFLPSILLVVVIIVTVVIVVVILIVIVVVIVGVVVGVWHSTMTSRAFGVRSTTPNVTLSSLAHLLRENTDTLVLPELQQYHQQSVAGWQPNGWILRKLKNDTDLILCLANVVVEVLGSCSSGTGSLPSGRVNLTDDEDPTDEDEDTRMGDLTGVSVSLVGEISSGGKKSQE